MLIKDREEIKQGLNALIDEVNADETINFLRDLQELNRYLDKYEWFIVNKIQKFHRTLTRKIKRRMKLYVNDILNLYEKYTKDDQNKVSLFFERMVEKYKPTDDSFWDRFLSVLRRS